MLYVPDFRSDPNKAKNSSGCIPVYVVHKGKACEFEAPYRVFKPRDSPEIVSQSHSLSEVVIGFSLDFLCD